MAEESKIYNDDGELIAVRYVEEYNGGHRVTTQHAWELDLTLGLGLAKTEMRGAVIDDRDVYADGSEYNHKGSRLK